MVVGCHQLFFQPLLLLEKSLDPQSSHIVTKNVHLELQALCADVLILIFNMLICPDLPNLHHVEQKATKDAQAHSRQLSSNSIVKHLTCRSQQKRTAKQRSYLTHAYYLVRLDASTEAVTSVLITCVQGVPEFWDFWF